MMRYFSSPLGEAEKEKLDKHAQKGEVRPYWFSTNMMPEKEKTAAHAQKGQVTHTPSTHLQPPLRHAHQIAELVEEAGADVGIPVGGAGGDFVEVEGDDLAAA
jgi:hypothetical protein